MSSATDAGPGWPGVGLVVCLLLLVPAPQAVGQGLHQYACEQVQQTPAGSMGSSGVATVDECTGSGDEEGQGGPVASGAESRAVDGARETLTAPPDSEGYPLVTFSGSGEVDRPARVRVSEPSLHSILVEDLPAFEQLAVQFLPAGSPDLGRVSPCLEGTPVDRALADTPLDQGEGYGTWLEVSEGDDGANVSGGLFPEDGFCAAVEASARASVGGPLFDTDQRLASCTALACEFQTKDTVAPEEGDDEQGTALFGPLVLYPGRWQIVRTDAEDVLGHVDGVGGEVLACDNPVVVLCFDVETCARTNDLASEAPRERVCPQGAGSGAMPMSSSDGSGEDGSCTTFRETSGDRIDYRWEHCQERCSYETEGELRRADSEVEWSWTGDDGGEIFKAGSVWDARAERSGSRGASSCDHHTWREDEVAEVSLGVSGPRYFAGDRGDTWNVSLHASTRECHREDFPFRDEDRDRCHSTILKKPVIVAPDYRETREDEDCQSRQFGPPNNGASQCVRVALDADVVEPYNRARQTLYHSGGDGDQMGFDDADERKSSPEMTCALVGLGFRLFGGPGLVSIACDAGVRAAELWAADPDQEENPYGEYQGSFNEESGYRCEGACWYLANHIQSNLGEDAKRDQMAFGAEIEMDACGEGWAEAYVAGTYLKGMAYRGPAGEIEEGSGDPTDASGRHYWGPGLTTKAHIPVQVGEETPPCPHQRWS